jgi:CubicO group peptidase (beta-lactamase class C family)
MPFEKTHKSNNKEITMKYVLTILMIMFSNFIIGQTNQFTDVLNYYNSDKNFNGVALVATNGEIDYINGIGIANRQSGTTINSKSKFKIASMTKTFTAVLILQLFEQDKLDLKANFGKYFPTYKGEAKDKVTIEQLLTYSSQIPAESEDFEMQPYQKSMTLDSFIDKYCSGRLLGEPGTKSNYSNTEYIILQKIIENITSKPYEKVLQEKILNPLKMENTNMLKSEDIISGLVSSYIVNDSTKVVSSEVPYFIENFFGAGAMYSTVEDLLKFDFAIFNYKLLNETNSKLLITPNKELDNVAFGVWYASGYGTFSKPFIYRTGGIQGSCSNWIHSIEDKKSIIVFNNTDGTNLYEMSENLYLASKGEKTNIPVIEQSELSKSFDNDKIKGTWSIDLRPTPNSEPYLKDFIITSIKGKEFGGEFYGTEFSTGILNSDWQDLYFAFTTKDKTSTYFHSGYIDGNKIYGVSYSDERKFTSHWSGTKK